MRDSPIQFAVTPAARSSPPAARSSPPADRSSPPAAGRLPATGPPGHRATGHRPPATGHRPPAKEVTAKEVTAEQVRNWNAHQDSLDDATEYAITETYAEEDTLTFIAHAGGMGTA